ncbi:hypothetical protein CIHG_03907 [Coccidioides immitis H538.4]|uniref:Uncharacterized protein n=3 Tax=Coccidioides immitis TaxID=5501 RepID=A0A0J8TMK3_COCIT|nr:hypothetical protein CIRG_03659 [Coccidioides immitis RMSCC 2394]KMU74937.1 hypothetical protein CISG_00866 [Coccidioides immitis RMSCC 3703]KMU86119.1 hypothetical protein CIHG_03907 [Coccidioides immitis H538.4]
MEARIHKHSFHRAYDAASASRPENEDAEAELRYAYVRNLVSEGHADEHDGRYPSAHSISNSNQVIDSSAIFDNGGSGVVVVGPYVQ